MAYKNNKEKIKTALSNEELKKYYDRKNDIMNKYFPFSKLEAYQFFNAIYEEAINNDIFQFTDGIRDGRANGLILLYSPDLSRKIYYETGKENHSKDKLIVKRDSVRGLDIDGLNDVLASTNLHYGKSSDSIAYFCNFDIDFDGVYEPYDLFRLLDAFRTKKIPTPTVLVSSGTGVHLIYRLKTPINVYKKPALKSVITEIKKAICEKLKRVYKFIKYSGDISPLSWEQKIRCPGSTTKIGEIIANSREEALYDLCNAWLIGDSYSLIDIYNYCKKYTNINKIKKLGDTDEDLISKLLEKSKNLEKINIKGIEGSKGKLYKSVNKNVYHGWFSRRVEIKEGFRYFYMLGLTCYALKCNIDKETLNKDLIKLMDYFNEKSESKVTLKDVESALKGYDDDANKFSTGETIARRCNLTVKHCKRNHRTQKEHLTRARKKAGRKSKKDELYSFLIGEFKCGKDITKMSVRTIEQASGISKSTASKYYKELVSSIITKN